LTLKEKKNFNQSRVVTKLTRGLEKTSYSGSANIFICNIGVQLPDKAAETVINIGQKMVEKFVDKFDWAKSRMGLAASAAAASGASYGGTGATEDQQFSTDADKTDDIPLGKEPEQKKAAPKPTAQVPEENIGFEDINF